MFSSSHLSCSNVLCVRFWTLSSEWWIIISTVDVIWYFNRNTFEFSNILSFIFSYFFLIIMMLCLPSHHSSDEGDWNKLNLIFRVFTENIMKLSYKKNYHKIFAMFHKLNEINLLWSTSRSSSYELMMMIYRLHAMFLTCVTSWIEYFSLCGKKKINK